MVLQKNPGRCHCDWERCQCILPILHQMAEWFAKLFHCQTWQWICNNVIVEDSTTQLHWRVKYLTLFVLTIASGLLVSAPPCRCSMHMLVNVEGVIVQPSSERNADLPGLREVPSHRMSSVLLADAQSSMAFQLCCFQVPPTITVNCQPLLPAHDIIPKTFAVIFPTQTIRPDWKLRRCLCRNSSDTIT